RCGPMVNKPSTADKRVSPFSPAKAGQNRGWSETTADREEFLAPRAPDFVGRHAVEGGKRGGDRLAGRLDHHVRLPMRAAERLRHDHVDDAEPREVLRRD